MSGLAQFFRNHIPENEGREHAYDESLLSLQDLTLPQAPAATDQRTPEVSHNQLPRLTEKALSYRSWKQESQSYFLDFWI